MLTIVWMPDDDTMPMSLSVMKVNCSIQFMMTRSPEISVTDQLSGKPPAGVGSAPSAEGSVCWNIAMLKLSVGSLSPSVQELSEEPIESLSHRALICTMALSFDAVAGDRDDLRRRPVVGQRRRC